MSNFTLNIYTPNGIVAAGYSCDELTVPTSTGQINILKGHTHLITKLTTGVLTAKVNATQNRHFTVAGGMLKVLGNQVTVLAKTSEKADAIDMERAKSALSKAESRLSSGVASVELIKYQRKVERAKNRLKLANLK